MREIKQLLQPGQEKHIDATGDFIYCKFAERTVKVTVGGQPVDMVAGDKMRPARRFSDFLIRNTDAENAISVTMVIGEGDYNSQIIRGEVSVNPGIRGANGQWVDDTRSIKTLNVSIGSIEPRSYTAGSKIREPFTASSWIGGLTVLDNSRLLLCYSGGENWRSVTGWPDAVQVEPIGSMGDGAGAVVGNELWIPVGAGSQPENKRVVIEVYDAKTLRFRRRENTEIVWTGAGEPDISWLTYIPESQTIAIYAKGIGGTIHFLDMAGNYKREPFPVLASKGKWGAVVRGGRLHALGVSYFNSNKDSYVFDSVTLDQVSYDERAMPHIAMNNLFSALTPRDTLIAIDYSQVVTEFALEDVTISATGSVSSCDQSGMLKADRFETKAEIYAERLESGRVLLSGEVVRAVLEIYYGKYVPDDYLDYVYKVEAEELDGVLPAVISAGGQSFRAAGIKDDAAATFPQQIKVTLREGLF